MSSPLVHCDLLSPWPEALARVLPIAESTSARLEIQRNQNWDPTEESIIYIIPMSSLPVSRKQSMTSFSPTKTYRASQAVDMIPSRPIIVAVPQLEPCWLDKQAALQKTLAVIAEAANSGANLIAFGELWIPGYPSFLYGGSMNDVMQHSIEYVS